MHVLACIVAWIACSPLIFLARPASAEGDAFVLYKVKPSREAGRFGARGPVDVDNRFGVAAVDVRKPRGLGLPASIDGEAVGDAGTALAEFQVRPSRSRAPTEKVVDVSVVDRCGDSRVILDRPTSLLVPAGVDEAQPVPAPAAHEHEVDSFLCYAAKRQRAEAGGNRLPRMTPGVQVDATDRFQERRYDLRKITRVCFPTATSGSPHFLSGADRGTAAPFTPAAVRHPERHLVCYQAKQARKEIAQSGCGPADPRDRGSRIEPRPARHLKRSGVHWSHALGSSQIDTAKEAEICLPADVRVCGGAAPGDDACVTSQRIRDAFATDWDVELILTPADIPLPTTNVDDSSYVFGMYNPSVVYSENAGYLMALGLSVYCQEGWVARDSVGLLRSTDGIEFEFLEYLVEPDPTICATRQVDWPAETVFQVNDPSAVLRRQPDGSEWLYVVYTAVRHRSTEYEAECANIGLVIVELGTGTIHRNDTFLRPPPSFCGAKPGYGFSRPNILVLPDDSMEVWFDTFYGVYRAPLRNWSQLDGASVEYSGFHGDLDVGASAIGSYDVLLTRRWDAPGLQVSVADRRVRDWTEPMTFTQATGEYWDRNWQATAELFTHPQTCASRIYLAGIEMTADGSWYQSISVGAATPAGGEIGALACATARSPRID